MNVSRALALAFAVSLVGSLYRVAAHGSLYSHHDPRRPDFHRRATAAHPISPARAPSQGASIHERPVARPLVTNDSDDMSRDPEDCNKGCLGSSE
jgi:hypothetical protein